MIPPLCVMERQPDSKAQLSAEIKREEISSRKLRKIRLEGRLNQASCPNHAFYSFGTFFFRQRTYAALLFLDPQHNSVNLLKES